MPGPPWYRDGDVTRYLCAAVHLDSVLAKRVCDDVIDDPHRAAAPARDFDLALVALHALAARRRHRIAAWAVLAVLIVLFVFERGVVPWYLDVPAVWMIVFVEELSTLAVLVRLARRGVPVFTPRQLKNRRVRQRLRELEAQQDGNLTVYSGYEPFLGHGPLIGGWHVSINVRRPPEGGGPPQPVDAVELQQRIIAAVQAVNWAETRIDEHVFVDGLDVLGDPRFLPDPLNRPLTHVPPNVVRSLLVNPEFGARHYTRILMTGWGGLFTPSIFFRIVLRAGILFVEQSSTALLPLRPTFYKLDRMTAVPSARDVLRFFSRSVWATFTLFMRIIPADLGAIFQAIARSLRASSERRTIKRGVRYDYGSRISIREQAASNDYRRYFQSLDQDMYLQTYDAAVLGTLVDYLDERGVDTKSLVQRSTTILNSGVLVTGNGSLNAQNLAVGAQAAAGAVRDRLRNAASGLTGSGGRPAAGPGGAGRRG